MLASDRAVLLRYERNGVPFRASGMHVGGDSVLTADHCLDGSVAHRIVTLDGCEYPAMVMARSERSDIDIAILKAPGLPPVTPMTFARLDREWTGQVGCVALGFPKWRDQAGPETAQIDGYIPTGEGLAVAPHLGSMTFRITDQTIRVSTPDGHCIEEPASEWSGMSGSVVVHHSTDSVIAVISRHWPPQGLGALSVTPIDSIRRLDRETSRRMWDALGVEDPDHLPVATHPKEDPALVILRRIDALRRSGLLEPGAVETLQVQAVVRTEREFFSVRYT